MDFKDDGIGGWSAAPFSSPFLPTSVLKSAKKMLHTDDGETLRRFLKSRLRSSSPENKIIHKTLAVKV